MTNRTEVIQLQGRLFLNFVVEAETGLHIGGTPGELAIGNVDNPVVRNPINRQPYIPGSSLRGKMRSQLEKYYGLPQNTRVGQVFIHMARNEDEYEQSIVSQIFGVPGSRPYQNFAKPSRLVVRDATLTPESVKQLERARTDMPYTEIKWEATIDRITSIATPRQQERVPAGAKFAGNLVFTLYSFGAREKDLGELALFSTVLEGMQLIEEDYLGGQGSRGSGKVCFTNLSLTLKQNVRYDEPQQVVEAPTLATMQESWNELLSKLSG